MKSIILTLLVMMILGVVALLLTSCASPRQDVIIDEWYSHKIECPCNNRYGYCPFDDQSYKQFKVVK